MFEPVISNTLIHNWPIIRFDPSKTILKPEAVTAYIHEVDELVRTSGIKDHLQSVPDELYSAARSLDHYPHFQDLYKAIAREISNAQLNTVAEIKGTVNSFLKNAEKHIPLEQMSETYKNLFKKINTFFNGINTATENLWNSNNIIQGYETANIDGAKFAGLLGGSAKLPKAFQETILQESDNEITAFLNGTRVKLTQITKPATEKRLSPVGLRAEWKMPNGEVGATIIKPQEMFQA